MMCKFLTEISLKRQLLLLRVKTSSTIVLRVFIPETCVVKRVHTWAVGSDKDDTCVAVCNGAEPRSCPVAIVNAVEEESFFNKVGSKAQT